MQREGALQNETGYARLQGDEIAPRHRGDLGLRNDLKNGARCMKEMSDSGLCSDLDGDGVAGYPDSG